MDGFISFSRESIIERKKYANYIICTASPDHSLTFKSQFKIFTPTPLVVFIKLRGISVFFFHAKRLKWLPSPTVPVPQSHSKSFNLVKF